MTHPTPKRTPTPGSPHAKPLHVSLNTIGRGLVYVLPETGLPPHLDPLLKQVQVDSIATPWLFPFLEEHALLASQPAGIITVSAEGGVVRAHARLSFQPELECVRCLERFRLPIEAEATAIFADEARFSRPKHASGPQKRVHTDDDDDDGVDLEATDLDTYPYRGLGFNLDEFLLDTLQTAVPDLPLCTAECPGLCPACGERHTSDHVCERS